MTVVDHYDGGEDNKCEGYFVPSETHREPCRAEAVNACLVDNLLTCYSIELKLYETFALIRRTFSPSRRTFWPSLTTIRSLFRARVRVRSREQIAMHNFVNPRVIDVKLYSNGHVLIRRTFWPSLTTIRSLLRVGVSVRVRSREHISMHNFFNGLAIDLKL